jgi:hypothetical protein
MNHILSCTGLLLIDNQLFCIAKIPVAMNMSLPLYRLKLGIVVFFSGLQLHGGQPP